MRGRERFDVRYSIALSERQEAGRRRIAPRTGMRKAGIIRRAIDVNLQVDRHKQEMRSHIEVRAAAEAGIAPRR